MLRSELVPSLALLTIFAVLVIAVLVLIRFLRKPRNQHPMQGPADAQHRRGSRREFG